MISKKIVPTFPPTCEMATFPFAHFSAILKHLAYGTTNSHNRRPAAISAATAGRPKGSDPARQQSVPKGMVKKLRRPEDAGHLPRHLAKSPHQRRLTLPEARRHHVLPVRGNRQDA